MEIPAKTIISIFALTGLALCLFTAAGEGQTGNSDSIRRLIEALQNDSWQIRWDAAAALGETKDPRAIGPLVAALQDQNSYVRMTAARSLGKIDDPRVVAPLIEALRDESHGVQKNALLSLKELTGQNFGKDPEAWQTWWEKNN